MNHRLMRIILVLLLSVSPSWAGDKKGKNMAVSFHLETDANNNPKMIFEQMIGGKKRYFSRGPEFTAKDITAFSPFLADNQNDYGIVFQLRGSAANRLENVTMANQGKMLIAAVNGRVVDGVIIDQPVKDGVLVVWNGIQEAEIKEYDKLAPRIGEDKKKKK
jgi:hypothetical protein